MKKALNRFLFLFLRAIGAFITWAFFRLKVEGGDGLPKTGPFIIVSNHTSFLDPLAIQVAVPVKISWITKRCIYENPFLRPIHRLSDSILINGAVEKALEALEEGRVIGIFPEGTRSPDGRLLEADVGVAILALKSGAPVIPVGVRGAHEAYPVGRRFFKPHQVTVRIGRGFSFEKEYKEDIEESLLRQKRDYVMERVEELIA